MKLAIKLPLVISLLMAGLGAVVFWPLHTRLNQSLRENAELRLRMAEQEKNKAQLVEKLSLSQARTASASASRQAVAQLQRFVSFHEAGLPAAMSSDLVRGKLASVATSLLEQSEGVLDTVIVTDANGKVAACAPANREMIGKVAYEDVGLWRKRRAARFEIANSPDGQGRALVVVRPFYAGNPAALRGLLLASASFASIMRAVLEQPDDQLGIKLLVIDRRGRILLAPTADLVGQEIKESHELMSLENLGDGESAEINYNLGQWIAHKRSAALNMTVIGLAPILPVSLVVEAAELGRPAKVPLLMVGGGAAVLLVLAVLVLVLTAQKISGAAQAAQALAKGAAAVELARAGARDELGELARALGQLGDQLTDERKGRADAVETSGQLQRDLERTRDENRELSAFQKELEERTARERETLDGELQTTRAELDGARGELTGLRSELAAREQSIAEKEVALENLNSQVEQLHGEQRRMQDQIAAQSSALAEAQREIESRPKGPKGSFVLFSEASEALTTELSALLEIVQGYTSQVIEAAGGTISDEQQEFLTNVINRSARSQRLLGDLRDFSNIVKPEGMAKDPVDMQALLQDVVTTVQPSAEDRGLELTADFPPSMPEMIGDEARLRQLFTVILQQAIRFSPEGGKVSLAVMLREGLMAIRIEDSAEPVPMNSQEVFGHFHGGEEEILETRGSGLRFPILSAVVLGHGGAIDLAINERGGNLFFIRLPVREGTPDAEETAHLFGMDATAEEPAPPPESETAQAAAEPGPGAETLDLNALFAAEPVAQDAPLTQEVSGQKAGVADEGAGEPAAAPAPDVSGEESPPAFGTEPALGQGPTADSILAAPSDAGRETPQGEALWDVPLAGGPVSLSGLEDAPAEQELPEQERPAAAEPAGPESGSGGDGESPAAGIENESAAQDAPLAQEESGADDSKDSEKPAPPPFSFGSDEIIQE